MDAPRSLNEPVRWRFSAFSATGTPRACDRPGEASMGVRHASPSSLAWAFSMSADVTMAVNKATLDVRVEMTTESPTPSAQAPFVTSDKGLKANAIGFVDAVVIGLAATAPAYSLAAVIGSTAVIAGLQTPAVLLASFVPMFLIATAFYYLNRADQDCGTTFSWVTRAMGPWFGWIGGWAIGMTGVLVIGSLADVGARYTFLLVGWDSAAESKAAVMGFAVAIIIVMTAICVIGTELSARVQNVMIVAQVGALLLFAGWALARVAAGDAPDGSVDPSLSWLNPFEIESGAALTSGLLLGVFIYWGWESAVNLTEEVEDSSSAPGRAAVLSTVILLVTYVSVAVAVVSFAGPELLTEFDDDESVFSTIAADVFPGDIDKLVVLAIVTSAIASTQTTIIPASRTALSMARQSAMPSVLGRVHPRFLTPTRVHVGGRRTGDRVVRPGEHPVGELPLRLAIRAQPDDRLLLRADRNRVRRVLPQRAASAACVTSCFIGVAPLVGAGLLLWLLVESVIDLSDPANSYTGDEILGVGPPLAIGISFMAAGVIFMLAWRIRNDRSFWGRRPEKVSGELAAELQGGSG